MRTGTTFEWDPSRIIALRKNTGIGVMDTERNIGLSKSRLHGLEDGKFKPTVDDLIKMSGYFHVTINYILGLEDDPGDSYPSYEKYLSQGGIPLVRTTGFEAPWPLNIFDEIFRDPMSYMPTEDQMAGLDYAISTLTDREQRCVYLYLRDGLTLEQIGAQFSVGRERIRQIIARAIRKLRHSSRRSYLIYGKEQYENMLRLKEEAIVEIWKKQNIPDSPYNIDILNLEPSVRSYNCLKRAGCKTVSDVIKIIEDGSIVKVRNLGRKSILEVLALVNKTTGSDYTLEAVTENFKKHL